MKAITGTQIYSMFKCSRAVALDLDGDPKQRRPWREEEEFVLCRGRQHEARIVADLGWPEPEYPQREFEAGAAATEALLRAGVPGVVQGVLLGDGRLGIPDLLRREPGESCFGDYHYAVGDIKSSARPRGDQILQVAFYSELLAELQLRPPRYGYLILKDGSEYRFELADYAAALREVRERIEELHAEPSAERPFLSRECDSCRWSEVCLPELEAADDLSLLQGMTRGVRRILEGAGLCRAADLADLAVERTARRTHFEPALLRRLKRAALARLAGSPLSEARGRQGDIHTAACVHFLGDAFAERVLFMGLLQPATSAGEAHCILPATRNEEWDAFHELISHLPQDGQLLHYGSTVPRWYEQQAYGRTRSMAIESRFVDLARQLRGAAVYPAPVFGLAGHVRHGLDRDPHRMGRVGCAAMQAVEEGGSDWLWTKGRSDLFDLAALKAALLDEVLEMRGAVDGPLV